MMYKWVCALMLLNTVADAANIARGEQLYRIGDRTKHITACIACHGPTGTGNADAGFPKLQGQHSKYTIAQLKAFQEGTRHNDATGVMHIITLQMSMDDMQALANYIEVLK